jgi:hypothetical protein
LLGRPSGSPLPHLRVHEHPAFPAPSVLWAEGFVEPGRIGPRGGGRVSGERRHCEERKRRSNPFFLYAARWIASRSLSSGAHSRDPLARNDGPLPTTPPLVQAGDRWVIPARNPGPVGLSSALSWRRCSSPCEKRAFSRRRAACTVNRPRLRCRGFSLALARWVLTR